MACVLNHHFNKAAKPKNVPLMVVFSDERHGRYSFRVGRLAVQLPGEKVNIPLINPVYLAACGELRPSDISKVFKLLTGEVIEFAHDDIVGCPRVASTAWQR